LQALDALAWAATGVVLDIDTITVQSIRGQTGYPDPRMRVEACVGSRKDTAIWDRPLETRSCQPHGARFGWAPGAALRLGEGDRVEGRRIPVGSGEQGGRGPAASGRSAQSLTLPRRRVSRARPRDGGPQVPGPGPHQRSNDPHGRSRSAAPAAGAPRRPWVADVESHEALSDGRASSVGTGDAESRRLAGATTQPLRTTMRPTRRERLVLSLPRPTGLGPAGKR
jgi:hypothetical protein